MEQPYQLDIYISINNKRYISNTEYINKRQRIDKKNNIYSLIPEKPKGYKRKFDQKD